MRYNLFITILILLVISRLSYAEEKIVRIATLPDFAPFCIADENYSSTQIIPAGKDAVGFRGYSWDVIRDSFHEIGYTIHLSISPWTRAMSYLKKGKVDILFPTSKNPERQKIFNYSDEFINESNFVIYTRADNEIEWKDWESSKDLTIGVKKGFNYGEKWRAATDIKKYAVKTIMQGFNMLNAKRLDGFVGYEYNWDYLLKQKNLQTKYRKHSVFDSTLEYLVSLKNNPNGKEILEAFDAGKKRLIKSGKLADINNKWFGSYQGSD